MFQIFLIIISMHDLVVSSNTSSDDKNDVMMLLEEFMKNNNEMIGNRTIEIETKLSDSLSPESVTVKNCGLSHSVDKSLDGNKIVGGKVSRVGENPWIVMLNIKITNKKIARCSGALINRNWVITAAHCISSERNGKLYPIQKLEALVGVQKRNKLNKNTQKRVVDHIIPHPKWKGRNGDLANDLALLRIDNPFKITHENGGTINGICFPPKTNPPFEYVGNARVAGWGLTSDRLLLGKPSNELKYTTVTIIDNEQCRKYPFPVKIKDSMMCQGVDLTSPCQGDSGGPLIVYLNNEEPAILLGTVSFGPGFCANILIPNAIYTKISYYIDWIENTIRNHCKNYGCTRNN